MRMMLMMLLLLLLMMMMMMMAPTRRPRANTPGVGGRGRQPLNLCMNSLGLGGISWWFYHSKRGIQQMEVDCQVGFCPHRMTSIGPGDFGQISCKWCWCKLKKVKCKNNVSIYTHIYIYIRRPRQTQGGARRGIYTTYNSISISPALQPNSKRTICDWQRLGPAAWISDRVLPTWFPESTNRPHIRTGVLKISRGTDNVKSGCTQ